MPSPRRFLIVDDNADSRFLLVKTLLRKFPLAALLETQEGDAALAMMRAEPLDAIIVHRAAEIDGVTLVRMLREVNSTIPLVMVSGIDRSRQAMEAGATTFLSYDAWLRIGTVVDEILTARELPGEAAGLSDSTPTTEASRTSGAANRG
jgi:DNA-binding NtrC family response regulator